MRKEAEESKDKEAKRESMWKDHVKDILENLVGTKCNVIHANVKFRIVKMKKVLK